MNYDDERFKQVESQEKQALQNVNNTYNNMINQSDKFYQDQIKAAEDYGKKQTEIQQANTDFAIEQIKQQKEQAQQDYTKEQKGAYADWQRQSNQYGVNAEQMATSGLTNTGYSESSQVSMYNTYQNRVSQARDTFNRAVLEYDNGIKEAQLTNNAKLAEIAYNALQTKLQLSLDGFQAKNQYLQQQIAAQNDVYDRYYDRWQDVLKQLNTEKAQAEEIRQFNEKMAEDKRQFDEKMKEEQRQFNQQYNLSKSTSIKSSGGGSSKGNTISISGANVPSGTNELTAKQSGNNAGATVVQGANLLNNAVAGNGNKAITTQAGQQALAYIKVLQASKSILPKNNKKLTNSEIDLLTKFLGKQRASGMTDAEMKYITNYVNNNFSKKTLADKWWG